MPVKQKMQPNKTT